MPTPNSKRGNRLPEIVVAGLIFATGAFVWSQHLAPKPEKAPGLKASDTPQLAIPVQWKPASNTERLAAQKVIVAQLDAFKNNKWDQAITFQSKNLKRNFASPQQFREMIQRGYPQFATYKTVKFGPARYDGTHLEVIATLTDQKGVKVNALYMMVKEDGKYYVDGVGGGATGVLPQTPAKQAQGTLV